jgi:UDP:flavonoid glycosyltransferase YjiC (YdhE family)
METLVSVIAQNQNWQLVLDIGRDMSVHDFNSAPFNVILANSPPQLKLLERASMMITHVGLNSIKECIYFEVPQILYPLIRDQPLNAARAVYHGLGISGDIREVSSRQLHTFIDRLDKQPSYKTKIKSMSEKFKDVEESQPSVRIIETVLQKSTARS